MRLLAIDPGTERSAWLIYDGERPVEFGIEPNEILSDLNPQVDHVAIEMIASYGMPVGAEVFETCVWIGRLIESFATPHTCVYRKDVKLHLCGTPRAKDANIRQALIDRWGPGKDAAIGVKAQPGPLYGVKSHVWAALAVAVTWWETQK